MKKESLFVIPDDEFFWSRNVRFQKRTLRDGTLN